MIRIFLGNIGSGKTISAVKELYENEHNPYGLHTFSNIITKKKGKYKLTKNHVLDRKMFIKETLQHTKRTGEEVFKKEFNKNYWVKQRSKYNGFNIVLDEAHTLMNSRMSQSRQNIVMNEFLALARKIATDPNNEATLTLISQLHNRIDINAREQATEIRYHICYYEKICLKCRRYWTETSDLPYIRKLKRCPYCNTASPRKFNHRLLIYVFQDMDEYLKWKDFGVRSYITKLRFKHIGKYFKYYDTFQLDNLIS